MRGLILVALAAVSLTSAATKAQAMEDSDAAIATCQAMDGTGLLSEECQVDASKRTITASMDTTSAEARKMCAGIVQLVAQQHSFSLPWKIRIVSPYTNGNALATCQLK